MASTATIVSTSGPHLILALKGKYSMDRDEYYDLLICGVGLILGTLMMIGAL